MKFKRKQNRRVYCIRFWTKVKIKRKWKWKLKLKLKLKLNVNKTDVFTAFVFEQEIPSK